MDPAILRRFHNTFYIGLPDAADRRKMLLKMSAPDREPLLRRLVESTEGFSGSDLARGCAKVKRRIFRR